MAGICTGPGLATSGGLLVLSGARSGEWPGDGACSVATRNGLRTDPVSGFAWVAPDSVHSHASGSQTGANRTVVPATSADKLLSTLRLTMTADACGRSLFGAQISGGYAGWRAYSGNFWRIQRYVTISIDGAPVGFTGLQDVSAIENNSGGAVSNGGPVEAMPIWLQLTAGQEVEIVAEYTWHLDTFADNGVNALVWRAPELHGVLLGYPE